MLWNYWCHKLWYWLWTQFSVGLKAAGDVRCQEESGFWKATRKSDTTGVIQSIRAGVRIRAVPPPAKSLGQSLGRREG